MDVGQTIVQTAYGTYKYCRIEQRTVVKNNEEDCRGRQNCVSVKNGKPMTVVISYEKFQRLYEKGIYIDEY